VRGGTIVGGKNAFIKRKDFVSRTHPVGERKKGGKIAWGAAGDNVRLSPSPGRERHRAPTEKEREKAALMRGKKKRAEDEAQERSTSQLHKKVSVLRGKKPSSIAADLEKTGERRYQLFGKRTAPTIFEKGKGRCSMIPERGGGETKPIPREKGRERVSHSRETGNAIANARKRKEKFSGAAPAKERKGRCTIYVGSERGG